MSPYPIVRAAAAVIAFALAACGRSSPPPPSPICALPTPQASALPAAQVLGLGTHGVGETVSFQVPPGTGSVTIVQQGTQPSAAQTVTHQGEVLGNTVVPWTVKVGGTEFYNDGAVVPADPATWGTPNGIGSIYFGTEAVWTGSMTVPNTTNMLDYVDAHGGVPSGSWSVEVNDYARECRGTTGCVVGDGRSGYPAGSYDVTVLLKAGPVVSTGTLDVTFYLVTDRLDAATAPASGSVARMEQTLAGYLAGAGISLGTVRFVDLPPATKARFAAGVDTDDTSPCGEVASVLQTSGPGNTMNLFLVNHLASTQVGTTRVVGVDGTIPGPSSVGGTVASGALVSVEDLAVGQGTTACAGAVNLAGCGADGTAYVAAHETGHFLGLYHPTESYGTLFDPVKDTPTCACTACAPPTQVASCLQSGKPGASTYEVTGADCTKQLSNPSSPCGGGENLMFWLRSAARSTGALTAQQSRILRANALVE